MSADDPGTELYRLRREPVYHLLALVLLGFAAIMAWLALSLTPAQMAAEFGSIEAGRAFQLGLLAIAIVPILAWLWFSRRFVRRLVWHPASSEVELWLFGHLGSRRMRIGLADFLGSDRHAGETYIVGSPSVKAPYLQARIRGRPQLILDLRGEIPDPRALSAVLGGRAPEAP
jgi:hypothetical protein